MHTVLPIVLVGLLLGGSVWYVERIKGERDTALANVKTAQENYAKAQGVISSDKQSINDLVALRLIDAKSLSTLSDSVSQLNAKYSARPAERQQLEKTNVVVKNYLDQPVPDDLRKLLDAHNSRYFGPNASGQNVSAGATPAVPATANSAASPDH